MSNYKQVGNTPYNALGVRYTPSVFLIACAGALAHLSYPGLLLRICGKVFKNGPSKMCGRQPSKKLKGYNLLKAA